LVVLLCAVYPILRITGSSDAAPKTVDSDGCIHASCPGGSPPTGANATDPRLNYVNSFPVCHPHLGILHNLKLTRHFPRSPPLRKESMLLDLSSGTVPNLSLLLQDPMSVVTLRFSHPSPVPLGLQHMLQKRPRSQPSLSRARQVTQLHGTLLRLSTAKSMPILH
jgi:hypothetical protein